MTTEEARTQRGAPRSTSLPLQVLVALRERRGATVSARFETVLRR